MELLVRTISIILFLTIIIQIESFKSLNIFRSKSLLSKPSFSKLFIVNECIKGNFDTDVIKQTKPVIVDFMANWCGPCKLVAPIFSEISNEYPDIIFVKVDTDEHEETVDMYNIQGLPLFAIFHQGLVIATHSGALNKTKLREFIDKSVAQINTLA